MPLSGNSKLKETVRRLPTGPGVYLMKDRFGAILYIGKAKNLKRRVSSYFQNSRRHSIQQPKVASMIDLIHNVEVIEVRSESEAILLEGRLIKEWKPKYNTEFTDDKRFLLVRVDVENPMPRFRLVRFKQSERSVYFGPFAHAGLLRRTLTELRLRFGILLHDASPKALEDGQWQLYDDIRSEIYGHANLTTSEEYRNRVEEACVFLEGKSKEWLKDLELEMTRASETLNFERAAELRDLIAALRSTLLRTRKFERLPKHVPDQRQILEQLAEALELKSAPRKIECFDISHVSGSFCVASMVQFTDGAPDKSQYRRFRIKSFVGNDDFRAMEEVVGRRYRRLADEEKPLPDLIVIDGGVGQVGAALKAFLSQDIEPPNMIGLAKAEETVIFSDGRPPLRLPNNHPGRLLLQRIRDEAHRFANTFNADLRSRKMKESILDDFSGLGKVRRAALMEKFGSLKRLKEASAEEIREVEGIGPKMAARLRDFLDQS